MSENIKNANSEHVNPLFSAWVNMMDSENIPDEESEVLGREMAARNLIDIIYEKEWFIDNWKDKQSRLDVVARDNFPKFFMSVNSKLRDLSIKEAIGVGGKLPMLHTPVGEDKIPALYSGHRAIQEYIKESTDDLDEKVHKVAAASEALIIWTHLFEDGNGRTSRFVASLIEMEGDDREGVIEQTVSSQNRLRNYQPKYDTKEKILAIANNEGMMLEEFEREELREEANTKPNDIDGMYLNIQSLLESDERE